MIKKLWPIFVLLVALLVGQAENAHAQVMTRGGGTGTTSPSGILNGVTGNLHLQTLKIGSGLTFDGTTLASSGGSSASTTLLGDSNTFSGALNSFTHPPAFTTLTGLLKGNGSSAITAAVNGTDFTLLTANTCGAGQFFNSATAAGVLGCGTPAGATYTGTYPIIVTGSVISTGFGTTTGWGIGNNGLVMTGATGIPFSQATSSPINLNISGNANTATALATGRTISITGDLAYTSPSFDGSGNVTAAGTLATVNSNVGTFTYPSVTVNGKGLITAISNGTAPTTYTGSAPITVTGSVIGTSFSTSTFNAFTNQNTFTSLFATLASTTNATTTTLAITGAGASNCNGTSALTTNSSGVVGCTAQAQGTVTAVSVASSNGFAGSSSGGATPTLTLTTTITGLLKGNGTAISAASNGTDYSLITANTCSGVQFFNAVTAAGVFTCGTPSGSAYPFTPSTFGTGINVSATSTPILDYPGLIAATSTIGVLNATSSLTSKQITNTGVTSALVLNGSGGLEGAYGGASACTNQVVTAFSAIGATTCSTVSDAMLASTFVKTLTVASSNGFAGSSSGGATPALTISTTITGLLKGNGTAISAAALTDFPAIAANTILGNITGASAAPTALATSSQLFTGSTGQFLYFQGTNNLIGTSSIFIGTNQFVGIGSTTPFSVLSIGTGAATSSITVAEYKYDAGTNAATSTAANIDCNASTQIAWPIGTSASTLTLTNLIPGKKCIVVVQNPNGVAGAITWAVSSGHILKWTGGTVPTQTTTANAMDVWSFLDTQGSSTQEVIGAATLNN